jgi:hypothetical protein
MTLMEAAIAIHAQTMSTRRNPHLANRKILLSDMRKNSSP